MPNIFEPGEPPKKKGEAKLRGHENAVALAKMRGQWAKVYISTNRQSAHNKASEIRRGKMKTWSCVGQFEAEAPRPTPEGWVVWARCVRVNPEYRKELNLNADSDS